MMLAATLLGGALSLFTACVKEDNTSSPTTDPSTDWEKTDQLQVKVTADVPTAVLSSFDAKSMGGALVRRLPKTTSSLDADTKMVLIKGEDILSRPMTEWFEMAKIYLRGGYIAVEKPHNAHLVSVMEQLSTHFEQATHAILTEDDGSGIIINYNPSNGQSANAVNAEAERFKVRIANIQAKSDHRAASDEAQPVAEMVIFSRNGFYHCAPFGKNVITVGTKGNGGVSQTITQKHSRYTSGLLADGAAKWINTKSDEQAVTRSSNRADGGGAINEIMSASEEYTYHADLTSMTFYDISSGRWAFDTESDSPNAAIAGETTSEMSLYTKPGAYTEIYRIWGVNNMETHRDYYFIEQDVTVGMGGKQDGDARYDRNKTLYQGPYSADNWIKANQKINKEGVGEKLYDHFYGSWFDYGEFKLDISGNGTIMLQNALPETDNNTTSVSIAVGETHSQTNTIGASLNIGFVGEQASGSFGVNYSHGWTDGTSYTMSTTTNSKELKCVKNTSGTQVQWCYSCGTDMEAGDSDKHPLAPDALTNDVNIKNQVCWSVDNPEGAYTVNANHVRTTAWLSNYDDDDKVKGTCRADNEQEQSFQFTMLVPNRVKQTWYMDVDFPELGQDGYKGVKDELTDALKTQFPDLYQPTIVLADQTPASENTIQRLVDASKKMLNDPNALQTLKGYALDRGVSQFTIKWYCTDGNHPEPYTMTVQAK